MTTNNWLYLNTPATRHQIRNAIVQADIGLIETPDFQKLSGAISESTDVTIRDDLSSRTGRLDNGVIPTLQINFYFRKKDWHEYDRQTVLGVMAVLKAFPDADAYWVALDGEHPMLLRRDGQLMLAQQQTEPRELWDPARNPSYVAMADLPHTIAPLGPWNFIEWDFGNVSSLSRNTIRNEPSIIQS